MRVSLAAVARDAEQFPIVLDDVFWLGLRPPPRAPQRIASSLCCLTNFRALAPTRF
jgi:hypothetical protein